MHDEVDRYIQDPDPALVVVWLHKGGVKGKGLLDRVKKKSTKVFPAEPLKKASEKMEFLQGEFKSLGRKIAPAALAALVAGYADMREMVSASRQQ
jgi:DNA polymerase-3 subunit delta